MADSPILITREQVQELLDLETVYDAAREGLIAGGSVSESSAVSGQVLYEEGSLHLKAAALQERSILSVKANLRPNRGGVSGILLAYDLETQQLAGIIEAGLMTALRTGAIAAVAAKRLNPHQSVTLSVLGVGPVGLESARALLRILDVVELRLWSRNQASLSTAANLLAGLAKTVTFETTHEAVRGANIIVTATPSLTPILNAEGLEPGTLILAMGADTVGKRELDSLVLDNADVVADAAVDALRVGESAYLSTARRNDVIEISKLLESLDQPGRKHPYLIFDSVGSSYVDAAVTSVIMTRARERGIGTSIRLRR